MTRTSLLSLTAVALLVGLASLLAAADLNGKWAMNVKGPAAHGDLAATLVLTHKDEAVTGTFSAHGTEHKVAGSFRDGTLQLETTDTPADKGLSLTAKIQDDGTLAGFLSGPMGDMKWTAAKESK